MTRESTEREWALYGPGSRLASAHDEQGRRGHSLTVGKHTLAEMLPASRAVPDLGAAGVESGAPRPTLAALFDRPVPAEARGLFDPERAWAPDEVRLAAPANEVSASQAVGAELARVTDRGPYEFGHNPAAPGKPGVITDFGTGPGALRAHCEDSASAMLAKFVDPGARRTGCGGQRAGDGRAHA